MLELLRVVENDEYIVKKVERIKIIIEMIIEMLTQFHNTNFSFKEQQRRSVLFNFQSTPLFPLHLLL